MRDYSVPRAGVLPVSRVGSTTRRSSATARRSDAQTPSAWVPLWGRRARNAARSRPPSAS